MNDYTRECTGCGRDVISQSDGDVYCPDCAGQTPSHGTDYQRRQAESQRADEQRYRVVSGEVIPKE